ncbi:MAG: TonB-dependent receptor [Bacteroidales bacterium]|nr:TonB-dependent receptor [Bacteroidales bacterium]
MRKSILLRVTSVALGLILSASALLAQKNINVTGTVTDVNKEPIVGAAVMVKGTSNGTATDLDGNFSITVKDGQVLEFSSIGFVTAELKASAKMKVTLVEDSELLNETVVVGYGVQKRESLTGSITQIRSEDIAVTKSVDAVNALQGKIPGLLINQNNGKPGAFASDINLRGFGTPIVVVDGVRRSTTKQRKTTGWTQDVTALESYNDLSVLQELNPEDIESISVLKDASATIYGLGAENGVILITTKKGQIKKPSVNFSAMMNLSQPAVIRNVESWTSFMKWDNAMSDVAKMPHRFTDDVIAAYENGDPNYTYTDWYGESYKKFAVNQQYNVSLTGGNETVSYYLGGNFTNDNSIMKADNLGYKRYGFNGNVTVNLTKDLSVRYATSFRQSTNLGLGDPDMEWNLNYYAYSTNPMQQVHTKDNPAHYSDANSEHLNPIALLDSKASGYAKTDSKSFTNTVDINYNAPFLKGLRFMATGAYDFDRNKTQTLVKKHALYDYDTDKLVAWSRAETQYAELWVDNTRYYGRVQGLYDTTIGKNFISAMLGAELSDNLVARVGADRYYGADKDNWLYTHDTINQGLSTRSSNSGSRTDSRNAGYIGRLNYNYAGKYLVELMARYDGSYQYKRGKRWGFFPSYSLGWRVSEEPMFRRLFPKVNNLKLRWSDGYTGMAQGSAYAYVGGYSASGSWIFTQGQTTTGYANSAVENSVLTWARVRLMDFGVDFEMLQGKFGATFDWYKRDVNGIAATRDVSLPDFYAVAIPQENLDRYETQGLELSLFHRNNIGAFFYQVRGNVTFTRGRYTYQESEKTRTYYSSMDYWKRYYINRWSGYMGGSTYHWAGGQFTSLNDASQSQVLYDLSGTGEGNRAIVPGMYKIEDRNGNGYIDNEDVYYTWGNGSNPPLQYGLTFNGNYKNFDFSLVFNGSALKYKSYMMGGYSSFGYLYYLPSEYTDSYRVANYGDNPWDPETKWVAGYWPALARAESAGASHNATYTSSQPYNYINAAYLRLKSLEIGYRFSPMALQKAGIKSARVFFNGGNLLTICNPLLKYIDPESSDTSWVAGGVYPITRTYNFGFNLNF